MKYLLKLASDLQAEKERVENSIKETKEAIEKNTDESTKQLLKEHLQYLKGAWYGYASSLSKIDSFIK